MHHLTARPSTSPTPAAVPRTESADVVIVGARCAGAATGMLLARSGLDVLLLDRAPLASDTTSTHAIARSGVVHLHRWGLLERVLAGGAPAVRQVEFHGREGVTRRTVKDRHGVDLLVAPRRQALDGLLQQAVLEAGGRVWAGHAVDGVLRDGAGRVAGVRAHGEHGPVEVHAPWVVGADGLSSRVAREVRARLVEARAPGGATQYAYFAGPWPAIEYHLGERGFAGVFPTHHGEGCLWVCVPEAAARQARAGHGSPDAALLALIDEVSPELAARLLDTVRTSATMGRLRMPNQLLDPVGEGWVLVGDAGYHRDAITGLGISDAFRDAELLALALETAVRRPGRAGAALAAYRCERDRMLRQGFEITCELGSFPGEARAAELLADLAHAIDVQAAEVASWPVPAALTAH